MNYVDVAHEWLKRELERSAEVAGCTIDVMAERAMADHHPLFEETRHLLTLLVDGEANRAWIDTLDENAVYLPGFVIDQLEPFNVEPFDGGVMVEILTCTFREA